MNRNITGTIRKTDGAVWAGAAVEFELERSSYDDSAQYPMHVVRAMADENGEIALTLWINEEALRPSRYICTMPDGCQFRFTLPEGEGDADLAVLRESAIEEDSPTQSTLVAFLPAVRVEAQHVVDQSLVGLNAAIATKADQSSLDTTNTNLNNLFLEIDTKAKQVSLDATDANVAQLTNDLDALGHEVDDKASQTDLDNTNSNVAALDATLDATVTNLAAANTAIAAKANQSSLNTTNANVTALADGLATANADIATRARQTALNTTNSNVTALSTVVDTKASELALNAAITNLEDAINAAQVTLENLIEQKADIAHIHDASDIHNDIENAVGYFNSGGDLSGSDQFVFAGGMIGLGTDDPQYTLDLRHPEAPLGDQSRMTVSLLGPGPVLQLTSDPVNVQPPAINLNCAGTVNTIDSNVDGVLGLGQEGVATGFAFRTIDGSYTFLGLKAGSSEPDDIIFPPYTFGFYKQMSHGGWLLDNFYLVFHDGDNLQVLSFSGK